MMKQLGLATVGVALALMTGWTPLAGEVQAANPQSAVLYIPSQQAAGIVPVVPQHYTVEWVKDSLPLDGSLRAWKSAGIPAVELVGPEHVQWLRGQAGDANDKATFYLARDDKGIHVAVEANSSRPPAPRRIDISFDTGDNSKVISEWRDGGMRYDSDDNHFIFKVNPKTNKVEVSQANPNLNLDSRIVGTVQTKALTKGTNVVLQAFIPWKAMTPYVPISFKPMKFDIAVYEEGPDFSGVVAWTAGLAGWYDAGHFGTLDFPLPTAAAHPIQLWGTVGDNRYVNQKIPVTVSIYNHGAEVKNTSLTITPEQAGGTPAKSESAKIDLKPGLNQAQVTFSSEAIGAGHWSFSMRLSGVDGGMPAVVANTPAPDNIIRIQTVAEIDVLLDKLAQQAKEIAELQAKARQVGGDEAYPLAYRTLYDMFVARCHADKGFDIARVERNCQRLTDLFPLVQAQIEEIIANPRDTLRVPPRFVPTNVKIKDGYFYNGDKPVFLWGPDIYWFIRDALPQMRGLGFNTLGASEPPFLGLGDEKVVAEAKAFLDQCYELGFLFDANIDFQRKGEYAKAHPQAANMDSNNFMSLVIQNPVTKKGLADWFDLVVPFVRQQPTYRTYTISNEPLYTNYGEETRRDFIEQWLKPRYQTIEALNKRWKSHYKSFDEIQLVQWPDPNNGVPWYEFQRFLDHLLTNHFTYIRDLVRKLDPTRPIGVKFMAVTLQSFDMEAVEGLFDTNNFDGPMSIRDIPFLDFCRSLWPEKPLINTETHFWWGGGRYQVEATPWRLALHGLACGQWWGWHPNWRVADSLSNADSMYALAKAGLDLQRLFDPYIVALNNTPSPLATLFPDVISRRSDLSMVRIRLEEASAQYPLGIRPFYATERRIAAGELSKHKLLLAGESAFINDTTYKTIVDWVAAGGHLIVLKRGMAENEWGDSRDTSGFIKPGFGEKLCEGATVYSYGKGEVICVDAMSNPIDVVRDRYEVYQSSLDQENLRRRDIYQKVLPAALDRYHLTAPTRLLPAGNADPVRSAFGSLDWRATQVGGNWIIGVVQSGGMGYHEVPCRLVTPTPVKTITDLVSGRTLDPAKLIIGRSPMLLKIELQKEGSQKEGS